MIVFIEIFADPVSLTVIRTCTARAFGSLGKSVALCSHPKQFHLLVQRSTLVAAMPLHPDLYQCS